MGATPEVGAPPDASTAEVRLLESRGGRLRRHRQAHRLDLDVALAQLAAGQRRPGGRRRGGRLPRLAPGRDATARRARAPRRPRAAAPTRRRRAAAPTGRRQARRARPMPPGRAGARARAARGGSGARRTTGARSRSPRPLRGGAPPGRAARGEPARSAAAVRHRLSGVDLLPVSARPAPDLKPRRGEQTPQSGRGCSFHRARPGDRAAASVPGGRVRACDAEAVVARGSAAGGRRGRVAVATAGRRPGGRGARRRGRRRPRPARRASP